MPFQCSVLNVGFSVSLTGPSLSLIDFFFAGHLPLNSSLTSGVLDLDLGDLERPRELVVIFRLTGGEGSDRRLDPTVTVKFSPSATTFLECGESESDFGLL